METISKRVSSTVNIPKERLCLTPPVPKSVKIEITSRCDLKCFFCALTYKERVKGHIDKKLLFRILDEVKEAGVEEVGLFWIGEPFLNKDLAEYVAYAKKIGIGYVFVTSNARLTTADKMKRVFDSGLDSIKFSINARNRDDFKKTCGVDGFEQVVENIQAAHRVRGNNSTPSIYASTVFDPMHESDYEEVDALIGPYVDEHYPLRLYGDRSFDDGKDLAEHEHNRDISSMLPCWSLFTLPHISYDGLMSACFCDFDPKFQMADLKKMSFMEAWHSQTFVDLRRQHLAGDVSNSPCQDCTAYKN